MHHTACKVKNCNKSIRYDVLMDHRDRIDEENGTSGLGKCTSPTSIIFCVLYINIVTRQSHDGMFCLAEQLFMIICCGLLKNEL